MFTDGSFERNQLKQMRQRTYCLSPNDEGSESFSFPHTKLCLLSTTSAAQLFQQKITQRSLEVDRKKYFELFFTSLTEQIGFAVCSRPLWSSRHCFDRSKKRISVESYSQKREERRERDEMWKNYRTCPFFLITN